MAYLAGEWAAPSIDGPVPVVVGGREFHVPAYSIGKLVVGHRGVQILHVMVHRRRVFVLSNLGQLVEDDASAMRRALPKQWAEIPASAKALD